MLWVWEFNKKQGIPYYPKYRDEAMENTKLDTLDDLKTYFGDDIKVNFEISSFDVVQQNDVSIISDNIIQE